MSDYLPDLNIEELCKACKEGDEETVQEYIDKGFTGFNEKDLKGWTPLYWACRKGRVGVVKRLLKVEDLDINIENGPDKWTPLGIASRYGYHEIVSLLLEHGADPNKGMCYF